MIKLAKGAVNERKAIQSAVHIRNQIPQLGSGHLIVVIMEVQSAPISTLGGLLWFATCDLQGGVGEFRCLYD